MQVIVWDFHVKSGCESEFERIYGPGGDWASLFARGEGFIGTELLRATDGLGRYLVIDHWASRSAFESFRDRFLTEYEVLDRKCEALTEHEEPVGTFLCLGRSRSEA